MTPSVHRQIGARRPRLSRVAVSALVILGLVASLLLAVVPGPFGEAALPGVALGSPALLIVERTLGFFAAWLIVMVVCAQAFKGRLPIEVSGRGVRYADAESAQAIAEAAERSLRAMRNELATLQGVVADMRMGGSGHGGW